MKNAMVEQILQMLAVDIAQTRDCSIRVETQRWSGLGRDIVELRVFLQHYPLEIMPQKWLLHYRAQLRSVLRDLGLELAVDEWFVPSQQSPSCGCWITQSETQFN